MVTPQGKGVLSPIIAISVSFIAEVNPCYKIIELQDRLTVELETPVRALAPGQAGVLYKGIKYWEVE